MKLFKLRCYIFAFFKKLFLKLFYSKRVNIGKGTVWRRRFSLYVESGAELRIGNGCFFNNDCSISVNKYIHIGNDTILGENVKIYDHDHNFRERNSHIKEQGFNNGKVIIGNNCWIGSNVVILRDTIIHDNCVIGAGTVISGEIPEGSLVKNCRDLIIEKIEVKK